MNMQDYTQEERDYIAELIKVRRALHEAILKAWYEYCGYDIEGIEMESEKFKKLSRFAGFLYFSRRLQSGLEGSEELHFICSRVCPLRH